MINIEPIYEYVKGVGWQVSSHLTLSKVVSHNGTRATLTLRKPVHGERFYSGSKSLEYTMNAIEGRISMNMHNAFLYSSTAIWDDHYANTMGNRDDLIVLELSLD